MEIPNTYAKMLIIANSCIKRRGVQGFPQAFPQKTWTPPCACVMSSIALNADNRHWPLLWECCISRKHDIPLCARLAPASLKKSPNVAMTFFESSFCISEHMYIATVTTGIVHLCRRVRLGTLGNSYKRSGLFVHTLDSMRSQEL